MIELKNITKIYRTGKVEFRALNNISLKIESGEFIAIMGASGSGKSTLLNILGFLDKPDSGKYLLSGKDISNLEDDDLSVFRNHIAGFVFQQFHLLPKMTAAGNAEMPLIYAGKRKMTDAAKNITVTCKSTVRKFGSILPDNSEDLDIGAASSRRKLPVRFSSYTDTAVVCAVKNTNSTVILGTASSAKLSSSFSSKVEGLLWLTAISGSVSARSIWPLACSIDRSAESVS